MTAPPQPAPSPLIELLAERIAAKGPITFAEYMETALYHPQFGYYSKPGTAMRHDYFTNVDVSSIFGRLLARQLHQMWLALGRPKPFQLIEAGAGSGALAKSILDFVAAQFPEFYDSLRYIAVERSESRRAAQNQLLAKYSAGGKFETAADLPAQIESGVILSNEFFDALPVHRVIGTNTGLQELYVGHGANGFFEQSGPLSSPALGIYFERHGIALLPDQQAEVNLKACAWIREAGKRLTQGFVLTIDYGFEAAELFSDRHMRGTLLAYDRHRASERYFRAPGDQDITAHVDFTAIDRAGQRGGLSRTGNTTQANFLLALARESNLTDLESRGQSELESAKSRNAFKTLIHPEGMGETFKVLIQHKGIQETPALTGLSPL
ncbi:MAG: SAM-dependent methyltransferase [Candidatus Acidiferrales bacterium]